MKVLFSARIPEELVTRLRERCNRECRSYTSVIIRLITMWLEDKIKL